MAQKHLCFSVFSLYPCIGIVRECFKGGQLHKVIIINEVTCFSHELLIVCYGELLNLGSIIRAYKAINSDRLLICTSYVADS